MAPKKAAAEQASQEMTKHFLSTSKDNRKAILEGMGNNIELQSILLNKIRDFHAQRGDGDVSFSSLVDKTVASRKKGRPKGSDEEGDDESDEQVPKKLKMLTELPDEQVVLRRGQLVFGEWSLKLCKQLLAYVDPDVSIVGLSRLALPGALQLMEYCFDIRCFGDRKDRAATQSMRELWVSLKKTYDVLGKKLRLVVINHDLKMPDRSEDTELELCVKKKGEAFLEVKYNPPVGRKLFGNVKLDDEDMGPWEMRDKFSPFQAFVVSPTHEYPVIAVFPQLTRKLARRPSQEQGAVSSKLSHDEAMVIATAKRLQKSKKKTPTGLQALRTPPKVLAAAVQSPFDVDEQAARVAAMRPENLAAGRFAFEGAANDQDGQKFGEPFVSKPLGIGERFVDFSTKEKVDLGSLGARSSGDAAPSGDVAAGKMSETEADGAAGKKPEKEAEGDEQKDEEEEEEEEEDAPDPPTAAVIATVEGGKKKPE